VVLLLLKASSLFSGCTCKTRVEPRDVSGFDGDGRFREAWWQDRISKPGSGDEMR
jgi:hypothetical protein